MKSQSPTPLARFASRYAGIAFALDLTLVVFSSLLATFLRSRFDDSFIDSPRLLTLRLIGYSATWLGGLYLTSTWARSNFIPGRDSIKSIVEASWRVTIVVFAILYMIKMPISRIWVGTMLVTTALFLVVGRLTYQEFLLTKHKRLKNISVLVICKRDEFSFTKGELEKVPGDNTYKYYRISPPDKMPSERWMKSTKETISKKGIDILLVGFGALSESADLVSLKDENTHRVTDLYIVSRFSPAFGRIVPGESTSLLKIRDPRILDSGKFIKRLIDVILGSMFFLFSLPVMLFAALAIKLTSNGPIFYIDDRVGQEGKPFLFPKFRTMYPDSADIRLDILGRPDSKMPERYKKDPRITPIGRFLRRWSIDELPQLWCVVIGTMSLVGPRPILFQEMPQVLNHQQLRFIAKPGLTGLWQVSGRKLTTWDERMSGDLAYIQDWSLANDFALIVKTIGTLFTGKGSL